MSTNHLPPRRTLALFGAAALVAALAAGPALGVVDPSRSNDPAATTAERSPKPPKPPKPDKSPAAPITVSGTIQVAADPEGQPTYTLQANGRTYELSAGPHWFWGDDHPLADRVGDQVEVVGEIREGSDEIDIATLDGDALREAGRPPWAGGPKAVGERHPGWRGWHGAHPNGKAGKGNGQGQGRAAAPGQLKNAEPTPAP